MLTKQQKVEFVKGAIKDMKSYKLVGVVPLKSVPDTLVQSSRNGLKPDSRMILGRKTLLKKILDGDARTKALAEHLTDTSAIVLSNDDPFDLYQKFKSNSLKLNAKPNQLSPQEITIESGETTLQPGQAVTELKAAGIDVQIQKGKVVIAKPKVIKQGEVITLGLSKALQTLGIKPFTANIDPLMFLSENILFTRAALGVTKEQTTANVMKAFSQALSISFGANIVNEYTVKEMVAKAYSSAIYLGTERNVYDSGVIEKLIGKAALQANALGSVKTDNA